LPPLCLHHHEDEGTALKKLTIQPLTRQAFAPFGDVLEADPSTMKLINGGTTERFHALGQAEAIGEGAGVILNIFRGQPRKFPYAVDMMERHPFGSQSFTPLSGRPFVVVVSEDDDGKPGTPQAFLAAAGQGVNYRANVWHHPLMALNAVSDFLVVDRAGPGNNLEEYFFDTPYIIEEPSL
jgi:ureidoglycolate lyase